MAQWKTIDIFPRYEVSDEGEVRNSRTERILRPKVNQQGIVGVGLMGHGVQHHRSVSVLVAMAFVPRTLATFDTPINLDGDRHNNHAINLKWRPRWHAVEYHRQFAKPYEQSITVKIVERNSRKTYRNSWECCLDNGFLEKDLVLSILNKTYVWPTYEEYEVL